MTWTYEEIKSEWLGDCDIAVSPESVIDAFNRTHSVLGREWIDRARGSPTVRGAAPTLAVVSMGQRLASLDGATGAEQLIERLRNEDQSARAELNAIYLLRSSGITSVELYPKVLVDKKVRVPDFRIRQPDDVSWTYVEVTQPDESDAQKRVKEVLDRLLTPLESVKKSCALEIFLRREPTNIEVENVTNMVLKVCRSEGVLKKELPDGLGLLLLNHSRPGQVLLEDHPGEEKSPRLCAAKIIRDSCKLKRHIVVRMPFVDDRAKQFLETEARQLPKHAPGLIMVDMSSAMSGFKSWESLIHRRFQPDIHTRVGGMCLFGGGFVSTPEGEAWLLKTKLHVNSHAKLHLPLWIRDTLKEAGAQYQRLVGP